MRRWLIGAAKVVAVNLVVVASIVYGLTWRYVRPLRERGQRFASDQPSQLRGELLQGVSHFVIHRDRLDLEALPKSRPEVIRIGAFGDSFTLGDEVAAALSYPAQLQAMLREQGFQNVEVINFGASGWGLAEATRLWDQYGKSFGLSFVVLGPLAVMPPRDLTFSSFFPDGPHLIHGRYLLDGAGELSWVQPAGSPAERMDEYLRILPRWRYLRYDRNPPMMLRALLPEGRTVSNPFYFRSDSLEAEAAALYPALLRFWTTGSSQVVYTQMSAERLRHADGLLDRLVAVETTAVASSFLHKRTRSHLSGFGNHRVARLVADILFDRDPVAVDTVETGRAPRPAPPTGPLHRFHAAHVLLGDVAVATLTHVTVTPGGFPDTTVELAQERVQALLFVHRGRSFADGIAVPHPQPFRQGELLEADMTCAGKPIRRALGAVGLVDESGHLAEVESDGFNGSTPFEGDLFLDSPPAPCQGRLLVGGRPLLTVSWAPASNANRLDAVGGPLSFFRPGPDTFYDLAKLPLEGPLRIHLEGEAPLTLTVGEYRRRAVSVEWNRAGLHAWLRPVAGDPSRLEVVRR